MEASAAGEDWREHRLRAARVLGAGRGQRERFNIAAWQMARLDDEGVVTQLRQALGAGFEPPWQAGKAMALDEAIALARAI
jgi:hypothetical protein